jgi:hypothetical protein
VTSSGAARMARIVGSCTREDQASRVPWPARRKRLPRGLFARYSTPMLKPLKIAALAVAMLIPALCAAQSTPSDDEHHGPSPESIAACKDKSEGDACEFDGTHGHVAGMCHKGRSGDLACHHPHHHHDGDGGAAP